ncbi:MAG: zinc-ribbon domain-containing protein [Polyangiaceae bacterium]|nr:zinc-ribbon domain-containing protein [Polyangiaceae bacterium]
MDVRCPRCATDYEFDDSLISERGTTVKCTNCGHQFKIFPQQGHGAPEQWLVRTRGGQELSFTSLKDLQKAISGGHVTSDDFLSRGNHAPKPLRSIAELEGFFRNKGDTVKPDSKKTNTLHGVAPPASALESPPSTELAPPRPVSQEPDTQVSAASSQKQPSGARPEVFQTAGRALQDHAPVPAPRVGSTKPALYSNVVASQDGGPPTTTGAAGTQRYPSALPDPNAAPKEIAYATAVNAQPSEGPSDRSPFSRTLPEGQAPLHADPARSHTKALRNLDLEQRPSEIPGVAPRNTSLRWLFALVLLAVLGFLALTVGKKYVLPVADGPVPAGDDSRGKVRTLLDRAKALLRKGDLESAKEQIDQALGLSEKDAEALGARAELEAVRADIEWLKLRLLDPENRVFVEATQRELEARLSKADAAIARAQPASSDVAVLRAQIDVLRMRGQLQSARALVVKLGGANAGAEESAYVLAALDLAEPKPEWASVVQRLRSAALGEGALGRAQAALIYALVQAKLHDEARAELPHLLPSHPLAVALAAFVAGGKASAMPTSPPGANSGPAEGALPANTEASQPSSPAPGGQNFQDKLQQASKALSSGDVERADRLYTDVLSGQPGNTEALAGRADVAKRRGDNARAAQLYQQVLDINPNYLPAMIGSADYQWQNGNRGAALSIYRRVVDQVGPTSSYGKRAQARLDEAGSAPPPTPPTPVPAPSPASTPESTPTPVDTSDLPGARP